MKKIMIFISVLLLWASMVLSAAASNRNDGNRGYHRPPPHDYHQEHVYTPGRDHGQNRYKSDERYDEGRDGDRHYEYRYHEPPYKSYRTQPYGRYYNKPYRHKDRDYHYEGHWTSWGDWERYYRIYPNRFRHGKYYRDEGHFFFRFCDPDGDACLFYSIGR